MKATFVDCLNRLNGFYELIERQRQLDLDGVLELGRLEKQRDEAHDKSQSLLNLLLYEKIDVKSAIEEEKVQTSGSWMTSFFLGQAVQKPDTSDSKSEKLDERFDHTSCEAFLQQLYDNPRLFRLLCPAPSLVLRHPDLLCTFCKQQILGCRYDCLKCPKESGFHLCGICMELNKFVNHKHKDVSNFQAVDGVILSDDLVSFRLLIHTLAFSLIPLYLPFSLFSEFLGNVLQAEINQYSIINVYDYFLLAQVGYQFFPTSSISAPPSTDLYSGGQFNSIFGSVVHVRLLHHALGFVRQRFEAIISTVVHLPFSLTGDANGLLVKPIVEAEKKLHGIQASVCHLLDLFLVTLEHATSEWPDSVCLLIGAVLALFRRPLFMNSNSSSRIFSLTARRSMNPSEIDNCVVFNLLYASFLFPVLSDPFRSGIYNSVLVEQKSLAKENLESFLRFLRSLFGLQFSSTASVPSLYAAPNLDLYMSSVDSLGVKQICSEGRLNGNSIEAGTASEGPSWFRLELDAWQARINHRLSTHLSTLAKCCLKRFKAEPGCVQSIASIGCLAWEEQLRMKEQKSMAPRAQDLNSRLTENTTSGHVLPQSAMTRHASISAKEAGGKVRLRISRSALACFHSALFQRLEVAPEIQLARQRAASSINKSTQNPTTNGWKDNMQSAYTQVHPFRHLHIGTVFEFSRPHEAALQIREPPQSLSECGSGSLCFGSEKIASLSDVPVLELFVSGVRPGLTLPAADAREDWIDQAIESEENEHRAELLRAINSQITGSKSVLLSAEVDLWRADAGPLFEELTTRIVKLLLLAQQRLGPKLSSSDKIGDINWLLTHLRAVCSAAEQATGGESIPTSADVGKMSQQTFGLCGLSRRPRERLQELFLVISQVEVAYSCLADYTTGLGVLSVPPSRLSDDESGESEQALSHGRPSSLVRPSLVNVLCSRVMAVLGQLRTILETRHSSRTHEINSKILSCKASFEAFESGSKFFTAQLRYRRILLYCLRLEVNCKMSLPVSPGENALPPASSEANSASGGVIANLRSRRLRANAPVSNVFHVTSVDEFVAAFRMHPRLRIGPTVDSSLAGKVFRSFCRVVKKTVQDKETSSVPMISLLCEVLEEDVSARLYYCIYSPQPLNPLYLPGLPALVAIACNSPQTLLDNNRTIQTKKAKLWSSPISGVGFDCRSLNYSIQDEAFIYKACICASDPEPKSYGLGKLPSDADELKRLFAPALRVLAEVSSDVNRSARSKLAKLNSVCEWLPHILASASSLQNAYLLAAEKNSLSPQLQSDAPHLIFGGFVGLHKSQFEQSSLSTDEIICRLQGPRPRRKSDHYDADTALSAIIFTLVLNGRRFALPGPSLLNYIRTFSPFSEDNGAEAYSLNQLDIALRYISDSLQTPTHFPPLLNFKAICWRIPSEASSSISRTTTLTPTTSSGIRDQENSLSRSKDASTPSRDPTGERTDSASQPPLFDRFDEKQTGKRPILVDLNSITTIFLSEKRFCALLLQYLSLCDIANFMLVNFTWRSLAEPWLAVTSLIVRHKLCSELLKDSEQDNELVEEEINFSTWTLEDVVSNPDYKASLLEFAQSIHSEEYVMAYYKIDSYTRALSPEVQALQAKFIYETFIQPGAQMDVACKPATKLAVEKALGIIPRDSTKKKLPRHTTTMSVAFSSSRLDQIEVPIGYVSPFDSTAPLSPLLLNDAPRQESVLTAAQISKVILTSPLKVSKIIKIILSYVENRSPDIVQPNLVSSIKAPLSGYVSPFDTIITGSNKLPNSPEQRVELKLPRSQTTTPVETKQASRGSFFASWIRKPGSASKESLPSVKESLPSVTETYKEDPASNSSKLASPVKSSTDFSTPPTLTSESCEVCFMSGIKNNMVEFDKVYYHQHCFTCSACPAELVVADASKFEEKKLIHKECFKKKISGRAPPPLSSKRHLEASPELPRTATTVNQLPIEQVNSVTGSPKSQGINEQEDEWSLTTHTFDALRIDITVLIRNNILPRFLRDLAEKQETKRSMRANAKNSSVSSSTSKSASVVSQSPTVKPRP